MYVGRGVVSGLPHIRKFSKSKVSPKKKLPVESLLASLFVRFCFFVIIVVVLISVYFGLFLQHNGYIYRKQFVEVIKASILESKLHFESWDFKCFSFLGHVFRDPESYTPSRGQIEHLKFSSCKA